jgi:soluble lytic murein transglycosylase-like protein
MKTSTMKTLFMTAALTAALGAAALPARAQLSYDVDEQGNIIYTNDDAPRAPKASAEKAAVEKGSAGSALNRNASLRASNSATAAASPGADVLHQLVQETAQKHNVDPNLVSAVISTESNWNTSAISRKGAQGLMQLVPETAQHFGVFNSFDPAQNVDAGVRYLSMLLDRYNGDLPKALAAYNAGPRAVDRWGGVPDFRETREYVRKVTSSYFQPGSEHKSPWRAAAKPIYRTTTDDGRVLFTNE